MGDFLRLLSPVQKRGVWWQSGDAAADVDSW